MFELPVEYAHLASWTRERIKARIEELGAGVQGMTEEGRAEMHALKLALPPNGVLVQEAQARIEGRVAERVARRLERDQEAARAFADTPWISALDKARAIRDMDSLMELVAKKGLPEGMPSAFTVRLYEYLMNGCGHIAHYDRLGFWNAQLGSPKKALAFFEGTAKTGVVFCASPDYRDSNEALVALVTSKMEALRAALVPAIQARAIEAIALMAREAGLQVTVAQTGAARACSSSARVEKGEDPQGSRTGEHAEQATLF